MTLAAGDRFGAYDIVSRLGAGGMGEVYRARDTRLGRDVALKVLPDLFTSDPERLARFEREARLLATLNHPHIGAIYGLEHADASTSGHAGRRGLVLELVEGQTLAERLQQTGPPPVREALTIARQIADALEAAHEKGIVHRDLKPANISITHGGLVKVLDFGLAKAALDDAAADLNHSPTVTVGGTREGVILGTAAYMSPEQARGKAVDRRTDIWAFGCVVFEMLAGRLAFAGDTVSDTIAAILAREPDWRRLPDDTPPGVTRLLRRCLDKDPKRRLHDIADARIEIDDMLESPAADEGARPPATRLAPALWTAAGLVAGAAIAIVGLRLATTTAPDTVTRFTIDLPDGVSLGFGMALSPDGRTVVFSGTSDTGTRLYKRPLDALESVPIRGSEGGSVPFFSPDGTSVGFSVPRAVKRVPLAGGAAITVAEGAVGGGAATWLSDDTIVFDAEGRGLMRVPAAGGEARKVTDVDAPQGELDHRWPVALPGDRTVMFTIHYGGQDTQRVHAVSLESGQRASLVQGNGGRFLPTGHIVFQRAGSLWVAPFDESRLRLTGPPTAVVEGVAIAADWSPIVAVGRNGSLAYATGGVEPYPPRSLVWVDRLGREEPIDAPPRNWWWPQVSPDGKRLGFHIMDPVNMDAWIYELDHGPLIRMTYAHNQDGFPLWSPDGRYVVFWSRQGGGTADLYVRSADLTGSDRRLTTATYTTYRVPFSWADGGKLLVFQEESDAGGLDIGVVPIDGTGAPRLVIQGPSDEGRPAVSSDGRWIAYQSNASGRWEVYVQPFPSLSGRWQVSSQGGIAPIWAPDGGELFYRNGRAVMSVPVTTTGNTFRYGNPRMLFAGAYVSERLSSSDARSYTLSPDGRRFLMMKEQDGHEAKSRTRQIVVIANWVEELRQRAAR